MSRSRISSFSKRPTLLLAHPAGRHIGPGQSLQLACEMFEPDGQHQGDQDDDGLRLEDRDAQHVPVAVQRRDARIDPRRPHVDGFPRIPIDIGDFGPQSRQLARDYPDGNSGTDGWRKIGVRPYFLKPKKIWV